MRALYPAAAGLPGIDETGIEAFLREYRRDTTRLLWAGVVLGAAIFALTPIFTLGIPLPAFLLPRRALDRHALRVTSSRFYLVRQAVFLVKMVAGLCWGAHADVRRRLALPAYPPHPGTWRQD